MWLLAFETLLKYWKQQFQNDDENEDLAERLWKKEEELQKKIEEVDLYRNSKKKKKKPKTKNKKKKGEEEPDTDGEEEKIEDSK